MTRSIYLKLSSLTIDEANVRKTGATDGIGELKASIAAHGLLQPLVVRKQGKKFAVTAGQRRFYALQALQKDGTHSKDYEVHCVEADSSADATEISLVENTVRLQMHPADQFEAFNQLAEKGMPPADIAARFGYAESTVLKLLKLARVSPEIIRAYRADELNLEQVQAFASTDDHHRQEAVFADINPEYTEPYQIRDALTPDDEIPATDKRVKYVGIEAYEKAGGKIRPDLFIEGDSGIFLLDAQILNDLATAKLAKSGKKVKAEGWAWVDIVADLSYEIRNQCGRVREQAILSPAQQTRLDELNAEHDKLYEDWQASDTDEDPVGDRINEIEQEIEELENANADYLPEHKAIAGVFITIDRNGKAEINRGYVRPADKQKLKALEKAIEADDPEAVQDAIDTPAEPKGIPASLTETLTDHRSAALKAALAVNPDIGIAAAVHAIADGIFYKGDRSGSCLNCFASRQYHRLAKETIANDQLDREDNLWRERIPANGEHFWQWCINQDRDTLAALLTYCVSLSIDATQRKQDKPGSAKFQHADMLANALKLHMRDYFTPTADNYFSRISKDMIVADLKAATGKDVPPALLKGKKAELAKYAEKAVAGTSWLPAILCTPDEGTD